MNDTDALLTSWGLALHDKAVSTRALYADEVRRFARSLPEGRSLLDVTRSDVAWLGDPSQVAGSEQLSQSAFLTKYLMHASQRRCRAAAPEGCSISALRSALSGVDWAPGFVHRLHILESAGADFRFAIWLPRRFRLVTDPDTVTPWGSGPD